MTEKSRIRDLLESYRDNRISRKDFDQLYADLLEFKNDSELEANFKELMVEMEVDENLPIDSVKIYNRIINDPKFIKDTKVESYSVTYKFLNRFWRHGIAAALCLGVGLYLFLLSGFWDNNHVNKTAISSVKLQANDFNSPTLTLADGSTINLDSTKNKIISVQNGVEVVLSEDGIVYNSSLVNSQIDMVPLNTIVIPKGKQYRVVLPDGTIVWLNAASTLIYPVHFSGGKRIVEINGEAHFEVAHDKKHPFIVKSKLQELEVLGTSFNISSYDDDLYVKTTLLEGKVAIRNNSFIANSSSFFLTPGHQSTIVKGQVGTEVQSVDTEEVISWRKGLFVFNNEQVREVMKKVSRWYNVNIIYENGMEGKLIGGSIQRFNDVDDLMNSLQATGLLHYKMKGGTITIMK